MTIAKLDKTAWQSYFDHVSKSLVGKQAEIEVGGLALGNQIEADWSVFYGLVYDPASDAIEIVLDGLDHMIYRPEQVWIDHDLPGLASLEVIDGDGVRQIVRLRDPLRLPHVPAGSGPGLRAR